MSTKTVLFDHALHGMSMRVTHEQDLIRTFVALTIDR